MFRLILLIFAILTTVFSTLEPEECDYDYYWRDFNGTIPRDAIKGGQNNKPFYIAQIFFRHNELLPATIFPGEPEAVASAYNKVLRSRHNVKVLCGKIPQNFVWIPTESSKLNQLIIKHLIVGGSEVGQKLYIGRIRHDGNIVLGKIFEHHLGNRGIWVPSHNKEVNLLSYEVLAYECAGKCYCSCIDCDINVKTE